MLTIQKEIAAQQKQMLTKLKGIAALPMQVLTKPKGNAIIQEQMPNLHEQIGNQHWIMANMQERNTA
jgi:hypothetical protein